MMLLAGIGPLNSPRPAVADPVSGSFKDQQRDANANDSSVTADKGGEGVFGGYSYYYEPRSWGYSNTASRNTASVTGGSYTPFTTKAGDEIAVAGGYANHTADNNAVSITGGLFSGGGVFGGFASDNGGFNNNGSASSNTVTISGGSGQFDIIAGGHAYTAANTSRTNAAASGNEVSISSDITVSGQEFRIDGQYQNVALAGGLATSEANSNTVSVSRGTYNGIVAGGMVLNDGNGTVNNNSVTINGGVINGDVYGAWAHSGDAENNTVTIGGTAAINGDIYALGIQSPSSAAISGTVNITGQADLSKASVHGYTGQESSSESRNFELNIRSYTGTINKVDKFHTMSISDGSVVTIGNMDGAVYHGKEDPDDPFSDFLEGETEISVKDSSLSAGSIVNFATLKLENASLDASYVAGWDSPIFSDNIEEFKDYSITASNSDIRITQELTEYNTLNVQNDASKKVFLQAISGNRDSTTNIQSGTVAINSNISVTGGAFQINDAASSADFTTQVQGNITAQNSSGEAASVAISFNTAASSLTGASAIADSSSLALTFGNKARWNMTENSRVSELALDDGVVDLTWGSATPGARMLNIESLTGSGTFNVNTDIDADASDQIIIREGAGQHRLLVAASGKDPSREAMDNFIVQQQAGSGSFTLANAGGQVEQGLYFYQLAERTGQNGQEWYLERVSSDPAPETPTGETELSLSSLAGHYAMWYGQLTDLRKRMGEVRYGTQTGLWVRGFADKSRLDGFGGSIGYDWLLSAPGKSRWIAGMQIRSGHADQDVNGYWGGYGDLDSIGGSLYATWLHDNGWYFDGVATIDWYDHEIRTAMTDGTRVHDSRSSYGLGLSLEAGRRIDFAAGNEGLDTWFVEPQLEVAYFWVKGGDFTTSNGMTIDQSDMDSLTTRAGLVFGKKFTLGDSGQYVQPYMKAGLVHEFLGDQDARFNGEHFSSSLDGTRAYYGLGLDWQATDNLRLYMQAEREQGEDFTREYNISAGFQWKL